MMNKSLVLYLFDPKCKTFAVKSLHRENGGAFLKV